MKLLIHKTFYQDQHSHLIDMLYKKNRNSNIRDALFEKKLKLKHNLQRNMFFEIFFSYLFSNFIIRNLVARPVKFTYQKYYNSANLEIGD